MLHFAGVEGCFFVYLNGQVRPLVFLSVGGLSNRNSHKHTAALPSLRWQFVGAGKDSRLPSEFEVTDLLRYECDGATVPAAEAPAPAHNVLAVVVVKWSDASFLEQQDHWRGMAGFHRSVYLYSTPGEAFLEDVFARASVDVAGIDGGAEGEGTAWDDLTPRHGGRLEITARIGRDRTTRVAGRNIYYNEEIECKRDGGVAYRIRFRLRCKSDLPGLETFEFDPYSTHDGMVKDVHLRGNLVEFSVDLPSKVFAWSDERPVLYSLECELVRIRDGSSPEVVDEEAVTVGFRTVQVRDRQLLVNGRPVVIKGVNRHDHSPTGGKCVSPRDIREDLELMKEFNFNAVRTAHYPNVSVFNYACVQALLL